MRLCAAGFTSSQRNPRYRESVGRSILTEGLNDVGSTADLVGGASKRAVCYNPVMRWISSIILPLALAAAERAAYDSNGRIIALLSGAEDIEVTSQIVAVLPSGKRVPLQVRRDNAGATRQAGLSWTAPFTLPDGGRGRIAIKSEESDGVRYTATVIAESPLEVAAIEFALDLPRLPFVGGSVALPPAQPVALAAARAAGPVIFRGDTTALHFAGSVQRWRWTPPSTARSPPP